MHAWLQRHETLLWWLGSVSLVIFVGTIVLVPWLVVGLPSDYFADRKRHAKPKTHWSPPLRALLLAGKNLLGVILVLAGIAMLLLPGQGMLTVVVGIVFLDFPGKYRLERWLATRRPVFRSINRLRRRAGREPLMLSKEADCPSEDTREEHGGLRTERDTR